MRNRPSTTSEGVMVETYVNSAGIDGTMVDEGGRRVPSPHVYAMAFVERQGMVGQVDVRATDLDGDGTFWQYNGRWWSHDDEPYSVYLVAEFIEE